MFYQKDPYNINHYLYADDTQVYISRSLTDTHTPMPVNAYHTHILSWMESSKLKLNVEKTDVIVIGTKQQRNKNVDYFSVKILGNDTSPSNTVRNLGVILYRKYIFHQTFHKYLSHVSIRFP